MTKAPSHEVPADWLKGLAQNWRNDLIAAFSVALVAMPLALGIAVASGAPPMAGVISSIVGGVITTFFRGSHVSINGPTAGLIAVVLGGIAAMEDGSGKAFNYVLAAIVMAGAIQTLLGIFRLGRVAEMFPVSVIHGLLAAIGVIIISKQLSVALGISSVDGNTVEVLIGTIKNIAETNPFVAVITISGFLLLVFHARISYKLFHFIPAPLWVLIISIPFVFWFDFFQPHDLNFMGRDYHIGPEFLISIPNNPLEALMYPDFGMVGTFQFWLTVIGITLIGSVETLASTKAVDKLDPYNRRTPINRDLIGVGLSTMVSGAIGGLPVITVIVRSTVNVHNNGRTRWSNFFHGVLLILFIWIFAPFIQMVPLAALAAILVFTGFKLASPRVFSQTYQQGMEQLLFLMSTLVITLYSDLLRGIVGGILVTLTVHILLSRMPVQTFFGLILRSGNKLLDRGDNKFELRVKGIANFLTVLNLTKLLDQVPRGAILKVNMTSARLVDLTVLEALDEFARSFEGAGGEMSVSGFDNHVASTSHPHALKSRIGPMPHRLSQRQQNVKNMAIENDWLYRQEELWDHSMLRNFRFFETRPVERKANIVSGAYEQYNASWEISDITFDEGAFASSEVYITTIQVIHLPVKIPQFVLESEGIFDKIFDRMLAYTGQQDIDFKLFTKFSNEFLLKGEDEESIRGFFTEDIIRYLESENVYHIESNGESLLIFRYLRPARVAEVERMVGFTKELVHKIVEPELLDNKTE